MNRHGVEISKEKIAHFCRDHKISEFAVFGSVLRDDFSPKSDVDVLVTFTPDCGYSLLDLAMIQGQLQDIFQTASNPKHLSDSQLLRLHLQDLD